MTQETTRRPPQVTFAAGLVIAASAFVVLQNFSRASDLRSLANRDFLETVLSDPPFAGSGVSLEQGFGALFGALLVGAVCAAACGVLAGHALKGSRSARLALSVVAVPLFVTGLVTDAFASAIVAASVMMLWMSPAREWFRDGRWTPPTPAADRGQASRSAGSTPSHPSTPAAPGRDARPAAPDEPRPHVGPGGSDSARPGPYGRAFGQPYEHPATLPGPAPAGPVASRGPRGARPRALVVAGVLTILTSAAVAVMIGATMLLVATDFDRVMEEVRSSNPEILEQPGVTESLLRESLYLMGSGLVLWCAGAVVLAVLALRGRDWARILLLASAAVTALACLVMAVAGPFTLLPGLVAIFVLFLLRRPDVLAWTKSAP